MQENTEGEVASPQELPLASKTTEEIGNSPTLHPGPRRKLLIISLVVIGVVLLVLTAAILHNRLPEENNTNGEVAKTTTPLAMASTTPPPAAVITPVATSIQPSQSSTPQNTPPGEVQTSQTDPKYASLPLVSNFIAHPSDQFLVDMNVVYGGFPYKGKRAQTPHSGAHIEFENIHSDWPKGGNEPKNYPAIYAVADGIVDKITPSYRVGQNDRYGINIAIARDDTHVWDFEYSIEPLVPEPSKDFYLPYMLVKEGEKVTKGQIIAYMYLPAGATGGSHIHFELINNQQPIMVAPAIFSKSIVEEFAKHWGNWSLDGTATMPACMGWKIDAVENPFGTGAVDELM